MRRSIVGRQSFTGRGALSNPPGRFDKQQLAEVDDGWYRDEVPESINTTLEPDRAREVISTNDSPDIPFEQSINPYRGCETACIYCYARPSHAYMGLSPGLDFETRLFYKADAGRVLEAQLARRGYVCKSITLGANTDPYQPVERRMKVTRSILEVLARTRHPVSIITKHALILRDLDLLTDMARDRLVSVAGIPTSVMAAPMIPALNDHELEAILDSAAAAGARWAGYVLVRLPYEIKDLFREWLAGHYPDRAAHVMSLIRDMRGGRDYDPRFGTRMRGTGPYAQLLSNRFRLASLRLKLNFEPRPQLDTTLFRPPVAPGAQLQLGL